MGQEIDVETSEERSSVALLSNILPEIPYRLIIDLLQFLPISVGRWNLSRLNLLDFYGYFKLDRFRKTFLVFSSLFVVDVRFLEEVMERKKDGNGALFRLFPRKLLHLLLPGGANLVDSDHFRYFTQLRRLEGLLVQSVDSFRSLSPVLPMLECFRVSVSVPVDTFLIDCLNCSSFQSSLKSLSMVNYKKRQVSTRSHFNLPKLEILRLSGVLGGALLAVVEDDEEEGDNCDCLPVLEKLILIDGTLFRKNFEFLLTNCCDCLCRVSFRSIRISSGLIGFFWEFIRRPYLVSIRLVSVTFPEEENPFNLDPSLFFTPESQLKRLSIDDQSLSPPSQEFLSAICLNLSQLERLRIGQTTDDLVQVLRLEGNPKWGEISLVFSDDEISRDVLDVFREERPKFLIEASSAGDDV